MSRKPGMTDRHRAFLVMEFACYATPTEAATALLEEHGITITRQNAQHYDPEHGPRDGIAKKWVELFRVCRDAFLEDTKKRLPYTHKAVRLQELSRAAAEFKERKNYMGMARMLEQIAKECGGAQRIELTGRDGGAVKFQAVDDMTDEQVTSEILRILELPEGTDINGIDLYPAPKTTQ